MARRNQRSAEAQAYRSMYRTKRWHRLRQQVLIRDGFTCQQTGALLIGKHPAPDSPAVHHKRPHKGDPALFYDADNLEAVAKGWHDRHGQAEDATGYSSAIGGDGWPTDPAHPANECR